MIKDSTLIYSDLSCVDIGFEYLYCEVAKLKPTARRKLSRYRQKDVKTVSEIKRLFSPPPRQAVVRLPVSAVIREIESLSMQQVKVPFITT